MCQLEIDSVIAIKRNYFFHAWHCLVPSIEPNSGLFECEKVGLLSDCHSQSPDLNKSHEKAMGHFENECQKVKQRAIGCNCGGMV